MKKRTFNILGVPFNGIGVSPDVENPAQAIRQAGLIDLLTQRGVTVTDLGDLEIPPFDNLRDTSTHILNQAAWKETSLRLADRMGELVSQEGMPLILGGDCGLLLGVVGAYLNQSQRLGLVMLDGHADFRSPESSPSGEAADLPLWILTGRGPAEIGQLFGPAPMLEDDEIVIFGYREPDMIDQSAIAAYGHNQLVTDGITETVHRGLRPLSGKGLELWLHFDVDVIDPSEMPAVHFPEPGGLTIDQTAELLRNVLDTNRVLGLSLACYHNDSDPDGSSAVRLAQLLTNVLT